MMNLASSRCSRSAPTSTRRTVQVDGGSTGSSANGKVGIIHTRPLDLSIDEMLNEIVEAIHRLKARRLVIDSLSGFELALAPTFREDFRESLYRMVAVLTGMGITMMMTAELEDSYMDLRFSPHGTAFLTDAIIMQRYIELKGQLQRIMAVVKVRGSAHSKDLRAFEITERRDRHGRDARRLRGLADGQPGVEPERAVKPTTRSHVGVGGNGRVDVELTDVQLRDARLNDREGRELGSAEVLR